MKTLLFLFIFVSGFSYAADMSFERNALFFIAEHLDKKTSQTKITNSHIKDLTLSLEIFYEIQFKISNDETNYAPIDKLDELKIALKKDHWTAIKKCLIKIATTTLKLLLNSTNDEEELRIIKTMAINRYIPKEMRHALLSCFAQLRCPELNSWLEKNPDYEAMISNNVDKLLKQGQNKEAETYIESNIESSSDLYKNFRKKLNDYFLEKMKLVHSEQIEHQIPKNQNAYEELATMVFHYYLQQNDITSAKFVLEKHFLIPSESYDLAAKALFDYYFNNRLVIEAEQILQTYFVKGSPSYEECAIKIFNLYNLPTQFDNAEKCLQKHFIKGQSVTDKLAKILALHLIMQENTKLLDVKLFIIKNMSRMELRNVEELILELKNSTQEKK